MELDRNRLIHCYYNTVLEQYKSDLEKSGFHVELEYKSMDYVFDLYAENDNEKKVYEFRIVGVKERRNRYVAEFKKSAEKINAKPNMVYVKPPVEKEIIFDELNAILTNYFINSETPDGLDELSTHTNVDMVEVDEILSIELEGDKIILSGLATIYVYLQYGSAHDTKLGDGDSKSANFPLNFEVTLNKKDYSVCTMEYDIDTSSWDE